MSNFCQKHWNELRGEIDKRGLSHLIAKGGAAAAEHAMKSLSGDDAYEPLIDTSMMIFNRVLSIVGLSLLAPDEKTGSPPCPICFIADKCRCGRPECDWPQQVALWPSQVADVALEEAKRRGLVADAKDPEA